jgi:hypothetical protein
MLCAIVGGMIDVITDSSSRCFCVLNVAFRLGATAGGMKGVVISVVIESSRSFHVRGVAFRGLSTSSIIEDGHSFYVCCLGYDVFFFVNCEVEL